MKRKNKLFSFWLAFIFVFVMFASALPVSAELTDLTDTAKFECVGSLTENFDDLTDLNDLYQKSGEGVLSGTWRLTELSAWGQGANAIKTLDDGNKVLNMTATADYANPGGVDFMFDIPLAPEYILDISYDIHFSGKGPIARALLSNGNFDKHDNAGMGSREYGDTFQIFNGNAEGKATDGIKSEFASGTVTVNGIYNLESWTYSAEVLLDGNSEASMTDGKIGPAGRDQADTCTQGSTYEKLSFAVQVGEAYVDNISVKAYKRKAAVPPKPDTTPEPSITPAPEKNCVGEMSENFDGMSDVNALYRKSGDGILSGTWQRSMRGTGGSAAVADGKVSITAPDGASSWNTFSGVEFVFDKPLKPNYILEVSYEMSGGGHGSVFFNNLSDEGADISDVNSVGVGYWDGGFQFLKANEEHSAGSGCWVGQDSSASVKAVYNLKNWTYDATVTMSGGAIGKVTALPIGPAAYNDFDGTFICTPESKYDRLTFAIRNGTATFDNISVKAYKIESEIEPGVNIDFSDMNTVDDLRQKGFLINNEEKVSIGSAYDGDPMSPSMCINASYNGVNLPAFSSAAYDGAYKVSYWIYNANPDAHLIIDAPMVMNGWDDGSQQLLEVRNGSAYLNDSVVAQLKDNTWYRFENIINLNTRTVNVQGYDAKGTKIGSFIQQEFINMTNGMSESLINHFGGIRIRNWSDLDMFVDNIQIEHYFVAPSLTKYGISFLMQDGTEVFEKENLSPATDGIILNFGTVITDESAEAGIHLCKSDGTAIDFDIESNRGKYILKLRKMLEPNQLYTLTVDKEIANKEGTTMKQPFQCTFMTGEGEFSAEAVSLQVNGSVLENMTGVPGNETLKVNIQYVNSLLETQNIECIVNYYDNNNHTIGKTIHKIEAKASSSGKLKLNTKKVPENCTSVEVVLWSDLEKMVPYCDSLKISE